MARRRATLRRSLVGLGYAVGYVIVRALLDVARWIDDRLWPENRAQPIPPPVFLFGNARSGTTLLHRLMSLDESRFAHMSLYQTIFPRVCVIRSMQALARFDARLPGQPLHRALALFNRRVFTAWEGIHDMGLDQPEEDEAIYVLCMMTPSVALMLPYIDELSGVWWLDEQPEAEREAFMDHYVDSLRRHLFAVGGQRTFLNKSVLFAGRVRTVFERFPDARFVYIVRHPFEAIPSLLALFHAKWQTHSPEIEADSPEARALARFAVDSYRRALDCRAFVPKEQMLVVRYADLVADPKRTIEGIYEELGLEMSADYAARLEQAAAEARAHVSGHSYSLAGFGLDEAELHAELADVFDEFGFAPPGETAAGERVSA